MMTAQGTDTETEAPFMLKSQIHKVRGPTGPNQHFVILWEEFRGDLTPEPVSQPSNLIIIPP